ncbi:MAG: hypothetical protein JWP59_4605 [Massilia sp.]|nr:hypothetical protein [Massilia sp.]
MNIKYIPIFLFCFAHVVYAAEPTNPELRSELLRYKDIDQTSLKMGLREDMLRVVQREHSKRLRKIANKFGWPSITMVGKDGSQAAWLLVQHADADPVWQAEALKMMTGLVASDEVNRPDVAYLTDRLLSNAHKPQMYGTQGTCIGKEMWRPDDIAEPDNVERRREHMKMSTLKDYVAFGIWSNV